jgi:SAM-dependent methyltransferase
MKARLRAHVQRFAPELFHWYRSYRLHRYYRKRFAPLRIAARQLLYAGGQPRILSGPFAGMPYLDETVWGPITPKWLGCYELEIRDVVEAAIGFRYDRVIDVGCAEGYYAVGLAWRMLQTEVIAFDIDPMARRQTQRLAALAGVAAKVRVENGCEWADLNRLITNRTLVAVDVEGAELSLLNPDHAPALKKADLLVEIHEGQGADLTISVEQSMRERFQETHQLTWRRSLDRKSSIEQFSSLWKGKIKQEEFAAMLDEGRPVPQVWLWAKAKGSVSASVRGENRA